MEIKADKGAIFKNKKKTSDKHPEYRGEINVTRLGINEISLWVNTDKNGNKYFSVGLSEPWKKEVEPPQGIYEKTGKLEPISKEDLQDDTPTDTDGLPF